MRLHDELRENCQNYIKMQSEKTAGVSGECY